MSEWMFISKNEVQHVNGYKLILNDGCWGEPKDIRPMIPKKLHLSPLEVVKKMREGLKYASQEALSQEKYHYGLPPTRLDRANDWVM